MNHSTLAARRHLCRRGAVGLLLLVAFANAFAPTTITAPRTKLSSSSSSWRKISAAPVVPRNTARLSSSVEEEDDLLPAVDSVTTATEAARLSSSGEGVVVPPPPVPGPLPTDLGTEIFLGSLEENLATTKEIFSDGGESPSSNLPSPVVLPMEAVMEPSTRSLSTSRTLAEDTAAFLEGGGEDNLMTSSFATPPPPPLSPTSESGGGGTVTTTSETTQDTVSAILAVSSEAVERAQETLSFTSTTFEGDMNVTDRTLSSSPSASSSLQTSLAQVQELPDIVPAAEVIGDTIHTPSVAKILKFAVPAVGVWLCSPLLSLIDTSSVGLLSGTVQQAALNPAVAVTDYAALLIAFLYTATTNLIAAARETDSVGAVTAKTTAGAAAASTSTKRTFVGALQFSTFVGAGLGTILYVFAKPLLRAIIGNDAIPPAVLAAAMKYVKIRALGMPAAAVIGSAQAACLGLQDVRSPLYVLLAAAVVNFMGDMLFVGSSHPWIGGAAGAAWATVFSQYAAVTLFVYWLTHKAKEENKARVMDVSKAILELTGKPTSAGKSRHQKFVDSVRNLRLTKSSPPRKQPPSLSSPVDVVTEATTTMATATATVTATATTVEEAPVKEVSKSEKSFSARGFLKGSFRAMDLLKVPRRDIVKEFSPYILPVTSTQVGRVSGYVAMSHVISSALGTASMAAQQVIVSFFYCLCPIADSLSLTAQSFVPSVAGKKISKERSKALGRMAVNFVKAGAIFGGLMVGAVACIPFLSRFFTADAQVVALVNTVAPLLVGFFSMHGILCACEGLLLGQKDLGFLGKSYAAYFFIVPYFMLRVKRAALAGTRIVSLSSVWKVFLGYQVSRAVAWALRVLIIQRKTEKESSYLSM
jgi:Na+-driven multidrug efflux pump